MAALGNTDLCCDLVAARWNGLALEGCADRSQSPRFPQRGVGRSFAGLSAAASFKNSSELRSCKAWTRLHIYSRSLHIYSPPKGILCAKPTPCARLVTPCAPPRYAVRIPRHAVLTPRHPVRTPRHAVTAGPYAVTAGPYAVTAGPHAVTAGPHAVTAGPYRARCQWIGMAGLWQDKRTLPGWVVAASSVTSTVKPRVSRACCSPPRDR